MKVNHNRLDVLLGKILDAHKEGAVTRSSAVGAIAHVVAAVEKGNENEVAAWTNDPKVFDRWLSGINL